MKIFQALGSLAAVAVALCVAPTALADSATSADLPLIRVTGEATLSVPPDRARIDLGVVTEAPEAEVASKRNAEKVDAVLGALKKAFGTALQIQTRGYSLRPRYRHREKGGGRVLEGYTASNVVRIETGALDRVGEIIDRATGAGANQVDQLSFYLRDEETTRAEALRQAAKRAFAKAGAIAEALGLKLGEIVSVDESGVALAPVQPHFGLRSAAAAVATPVEAGAIEVRASLSLSVEASR